MKKSLSLLAILLLVWSCKRSASEQVPADSTDNTEAIRLADQQLQGYNKRDMEAFLLPYSDSVKVFYNLKELGYQGKERMRENYEGLFNGMSHLHCDVVKRIATGNTVVDHERISYKKEDGQEGEMEAIAIYKIKYGKIQEVYFTSSD